MEWEKQLFCARARQAAAPLPDRVRRTARSAVCLHSLCLDKCAPAAYHEVSRRVASHEDRSGSHCAAAGSPLPAVNVIDFHTHIFPDRIARQAVEALAAESGSYRPRADGTLKGLLASMDRAGIGLSVVANIATRPAQAESILGFCRRIAGPRIAPLVSFHPDSRPDEAGTLLDRASAAGIRGVKLHPMYQDFAIDDRKMFPFYQLIEHYGLFVVFHTGYDIAFPGDDRADVDRVGAVAGRFPGLTIVATHVGGWKQWDRAARLGPCANVLTETSMTLTEISDDAFLRAIEPFGPDRVLFGSDSPWTDQAEMLQRTRGLVLPDDVMEKILYSNAARLLGSAGRSGRD